MTNQNQNKQMKALLVPAMIEALCIGAGVAAWMSTNKIIWLVIGVVAGAGFSLPAVISYVRASKGHK